MDTYLPYLRKATTLVWAALVAVTVVSWALGTDHGGLVDDRRLATSLVLALAFVKVQLVGNYFMELDHAPRGLRLAFLAWVIVTFAIVDGIYLAA